VDDLGKRIKAARGYASFSQAQLAAELGSSQSTIQRIETEARGLKRYEHMTLLPAIARVCQLPVAWFYADLDRLEEIAMQDAREALEDAVSAVEDFAEDLDRKADQ
jgi:transcriptional regulator with XRE-family HTH domain